jgi:hypothetical protein
MSMDGGTVRVNSQPAGWQEGDMDPVVQFTLDAFVTAILVGFFALIAVAGFAVVWTAYHMAHDHWSLSRTWREADMKLFHHR